MNSYVSVEVWLHNKRIHTIDFMMRGKKRETYTGCSWCSISIVGGGRCSGGAGQCIQGEIQVTVCQSRKHRGHWGGGGFLAMTDIWIQWWQWRFGVRSIRDMKSCAMGWKEKRRSLLLVMAYGRCWCGTDVTSTHAQAVIPKKKKTEY